MVVFRKDFVKIKNGKYCSNFGFFTEICGEVRHLFHVPLYNEPLAAWIDKGTGKWRMRCPLPVWQKPITPPLIVKRLSRHKRWMMSFQNTTKIREEANLSINSSNLQIYVSTYPKNPDGTPKSASHQGLSINNVCDITSNSEIHNYTIMIFQWKDSFHDHRIFLCLILHLYGMTPAHWSF